MVWTGAARFSADGLPAVWHWGSVVPLSNLQKLTYVDLEACFLELQVGLELACTENC